MTRLAQDERQALCDLFLKVGPDAPTLCEGWTTSDLAAHLVLRERRPDASVGVLVPAFASYTARIQRAIRDGQTWEELVERVRSGPPIPIRPMDEAINSVEYFIHHEDVRRAGADKEPRKLQPDNEAVLWTRLRQMGRLLARHSPTGLVLEAPGYPGIVAKQRDPSVTVHGTPSDVVLLLYGRGDHAQVTYEGDEVSIERLRHAKFGL